MPRAWPWPKKYTNLQQEVPFNNDDVLYNTNYREPGIV